MIDAIRDLVEKAPQIRAEVDRLQRLLALVEEFGGESDDEEHAPGEDSKVARKSPASKAVKQGEIGSDEFVGLSTAQAIKHYLEIVGRGHPQGPQDMARALVQGGRDADMEKAYANVQSALKRLKKNHEIRQVRRGEWGLSSWYGPAKPQTRPQKGNGNGADDA